MFRIFFCSSWSKYGRFLYFSDMNKVLGTWYDDLKTPSFKDAFGTTKKYRRGEKAKQDQRNGM